MFVYAKLTHCSVQISIRRIIVYFVVGLSGECGSRRKDTLSGREVCGVRKSPAYH